MSHIYFTDGKVTVGVQGEERAYFSMIFEDMLCTAMDITTLNAPILRNIINNPDILAVQDSEETFTRVVRAYITIPGSDIFSMNGNIINNNHLILNTAYQMGSDIIKFLVRLHAQCEMHLYFAQKDYEWISNIIQDGLSIGILRKECGWESVLDMFRTCKSPYIITEFSVTDSFPNFNTSLSEMERIHYRSDLEFWEMLTYDDWWEYSIEYLRQNLNLLFSPDTYNSIVFGESKLTGFNLIEHARDIDVRQSTET